MSFEICYSGGARGQEPWYYHFSEICIWWGLVVGVQSNVHHRQQQFSCPSRLTSDAQSDAPVSLDYPTRLVSSPKLLGQIFNESEGCQFHRAISTLELYWSFLCWPVPVWVILSSDAMEFLFLFKIVPTQTVWFVCCDNTLVKGIFFQCSINSGDQLVSCTVHM